MLDSMSIVHVADFDYLKQSGIGEVVLQLSLEQRNAGHIVSLFLINKSFAGKCESNQFVINNFCDFVCGIKKLTPDIVVFHSLYKIKYLLFSKFLKYKRILYIIEPHGGGTYENRKKSYFKKCIADQLFFNTFMKNAIGIVYLNQCEKENSFIQNINSNSIIIPNGISSSDFNVENKTLADKLRFIFLARIDIHHKGIDILLNAIELLSQKVDMNLYSISFYGYGDNRDIDYLNKRIMNINADIKYCGSVFGEEKRFAFANSDVYLLTSRYEGMPVSVLEALYYGCPCIITPQTNMTDVIEKYDCGWVVDLDPAKLANVMEHVISCFNKIHKDVICKSNQASISFNWKNIALLSITEYEYLLEKAASRPLV